MIRDYISTNVEAAAHYAGSEPVEAEDNLGWEDAIPDVVARPHPGFVLDERGRRWTRCSDAPAADDRMAA